MRTWWASAPAAATPRRQPAPLWKSPPTSASSPTGTSPSSPWESRRVDPVETVVQVEKLVRHFGPVKAVDGISFAVGRGEVFGLLGPNGAGKTTTLETAEGLLGPTSGRTLVLGFDTPRGADRVKG